MFRMSLTVGFQTVVLPKSVTPSRIIENFDGEFHLTNLVNEILIAFSSLRDSSTGL